MMLFINFKILRSIINRGDDLKDKQAYQQIWTLLVLKKILWIFAFNLLVYVQKELDSYVRWFFDDNSSNLLINLKVIQKNGNDSDKQLKPIFSEGIKCQN